MPPSPQRARPERTLLVLSLGTIAFALGQTMIIPAIPDIKASLGATSSGVAWLVTAYFLTASISTPIAGRLGDMFGKRKLLAVSLGLFAAGSLLSAAGSSLEVIVAGRALQGLGGGVFPLSFGIIRDEFGAERVPASIGLLGSTAGVGGGIGLPLGGLIADTASVSWIFWISAALGVVAVVTTLLAVPESPLRSPGRVDVRGALVLSVGLTLPLLAVSQATNWGWGSGRTLGLVALGARDPRARRGAGARLPRRDPDRAPRRWTPAALGHRARGPGRLPGAGDVGRQRPEVPEPLSLFVYVLSSP